MKRLGKLSLRVRLTLLFLLLTSAAWGIASFVAWQQTTDKLDKLFDTQQLLFARRLSAMNFDELHTLSSQVREKKKVICAAMTTSGVFCGSPPATAAIVSLSARSGITVARWRWISSPASSRPG